MMQKQPLRAKNNKQFNSIQETYKNKMHKRKVDNDIYQKFDNSLHTSLLRSHVSKIHFELLGNPQSIKTMSNSYQMIGNLPQVYNNRKLLYNHSTSNSHKVSFLPKAQGQTYTISWATHNRLEERNKKKVLL